MDFSSSVRRGASGAGGAPRCSMRCDQRSKGAMTFVVASERDGGKAQRPEAVVDFFEGDRFASQCFARERRGAAPGDLADLETRRTSKCPGYSSAGSRRGSARGDGSIPAGRHVVVQRLVRPLVIVFGDRSGRSVVVAHARWRPAGASCAALSTEWNCSCDPFCSGWPGAIRSGIIPRRIHQTDSRDKPAEPGAANGPPLSLRMRSRQAVLGKRALEPSRAWPRRCGPANASQRSTNRLHAVAQRQRVTVRAIARAKFAFEIRGPQVVGARDRRQRRQRVDRAGAAAPMRRYQSLRL